MKPDNDLIPVEHAAELLSLDVKRLRGYLYRNRIGDPIGDGVHVYDWSLETLRQRRAVKGTVTP